MTRNDAVSLATDWLFTREIRVGACRYASFKWDFAKEDVASGVALLPSPFGWHGGEHCTQIRKLCEGWLVVFNPPDREPEGRDQCIVVWIGETKREIRQQVG